MNGDGLKDLIIGTHDGYFNMYTRKADGTLNAPVKLNTASGPIQSKANWEKGVYAAISDWNNDGLKDLIVAFHHYNRPDDVKKCITFFQNVGTKTAPLFQDKGDILAGGQPIDYFWFQCPQVMDLNSDGKKDLILGTSGFGGSISLPNVAGYMYYYENSGTDAAPVLKAGVKLMLKNGTAIQDTGLKNLNTFCFCKWDTDSVWDMLVIHENWANPGAFRGDPQRPTVRILRGYVPGSAIDNTISLNAYVSGPRLHISGTRVVLENCTDMSLSIYSVNGKLIRWYNKEALRDGSMQSDITGFAPGTYFYYFLKNEEKMSGGKFMIAR